MTGPTATMLLLMRFATAATPDGPPQDVDVALQADRTPPRPNGGMRRLALGLGAVTAAGIGAWWMLDLGESLGAGDPSAILFGAGTVGLAGAAVGAVVSLHDPEHGPVLDAANGTRAYLGLSPTFGAYAGETAPWATSLGAAPRIYIGPRVRLTPMVRGQLPLGATKQVEPTTGATSSRREQGAGLAWDARWSLGSDPTRPVVDLVWRPLLELRFDQQTYADDSERSVRRTLLAPANVGARWYLTGRQRFELVAGPRWDEVGWGGENGGTTGWAGGALYAEALYTLDIDHPGRLTSSRVGIGYCHSKFDGAGLDAGAVNGIFGPALLDYGLRWRPHPTAWAAQADLRMTIADGGGASLQIGVVPPPRVSRKDP